MKPYYQDNWVTLYCGDNKEILPTLGKFDLLLTDPPYVLPGMKGAGCFGGIRALVDTQGFTDMGFDVSILDNFDNWFCFCSRHNLIEILQKAQKQYWALLQWCKKNPVPTCNNTYLSDVEYCVHAYTKGRLFGEMKDKSLFYLAPVGNKVTSHPNEKPIPLITKLITLGSKVGDTILDPFAGSGTTGVAAKQLNRHCTLIELDEKYCEIAANRLSQEVFTFPLPP